MVFVNILNAVEKLFVEAHIIGMLGKNGAHFLC